MVGGAATPTPATRKVMVVADPTRESAYALQYALSHAVLEYDELILLHVESQNSWRNTISTFLRRPGLPSSTAGASSDGIGTGDEDFLEEMRQICEIAQPKIRVRVERVHIETREKANAIHSRSEMLRVELLIIGQRRNLSSAMLGSYKRPEGNLRGSRGLDTAEYLIEHSKCTCVGVQKKGQNRGYLLNTKTQKNFWLLA